LLRTRTMRHPPRRAKAAPDGAAIFKIRKHAEETPNRRAFIGHSARQGTALAAPRPAVGKHRQRAMWSQA
jgi:hypothetical protein